jgi:ElaA protein
MISKDELRWHCAAFGKLTTGQLYALLQLRQRVFVVEQRCAYLDADGYDEKATHVWAEREGETRSIPAVFAASRFFAPGIKYPEASFGRVVTAPEVRATGLGRLLVRRTIDEIERAFGPVSIRISAQAHLERFYGEFGFRAVSERYLEDGIAHVALLRG